MKKLAIMGGEPVFTQADRERLNAARQWPIITREDEAAALMTEFFQNLRLELRTRPKWKPGNR